MLAGVQEQQQALVGERVDEHVEGGPGALVAEAERLADGMGEQGLVAQA